jgi:GST-like protein
MIDLYYAPTPNGHKITLFLEEAELDYRIIRVDISKGDQFSPLFLAISPNNKIPAIIDNQPADGGRPLSLFESGEILLYLAEKTGKLLSGELRERHHTLQWLFWQVSGLGPCWGKITILPLTPRSPFLCDRTLPGRNSTALWRPESSPRENAVARGRSLQYC